MTDSVTIEIHGLAELQDKLRQLPVKIAKNVVYASLRKGAAVVRKQAQSNVPVKTGNLSRGFRVSRSRLHKSATEYGVYLTLKKGKGRHDPTDAFYGKFVEFGFVPHSNDRKKDQSKGDRAVRRLRQKRLLKAGTSKQKVVGVYFMRHAYETKKIEAANAIADDAKKRIQREIEKLGG